MATGYSNQLARQIGEHLVAAKLGRRGYMATPFAGNVPVYDLLIADESGFALPIQVKAIRGPSWQFSATSFLEIEFDGDLQRVNGKRAVANPDMICILVFVREEGTDEFYVLRFRDLQDHFLAAYKGGRRPHNPKSTHCAVWPKEIQQHRDNWALLDRLFQRQVDVSVNAT